MNRHILKLITVVAAYAVIAQNVYSVIPVPPQTQYRTVAISGQSAPGGPSGAVFGGLPNNNVVHGFPILNQSGQLCFAAAMQPGIASVTNDNAVGIWAESQGSLSLVARLGNAAPGTSEYFYDFGSFNFTDSGIVTFEAELQNGSGVLTHNSGIWSKSGAPLHAVALEGSQAPGTPGGTKYGNFWYNGHVVNNIGRTAFISDVPTGNSWGTGIWSDTPGQLSAVALHGHFNPPNMPGLTYFETFSKPVMNNSGTIAFQASTSNYQSSPYDAGIWRYDSQGLQKIIFVDSASSILPSGTKLGFAAGPRINKDGDILFLSFLNGTGTNENNNQAIFKYDAGNLTMLCRSGTQAPGLQSGVFFKNFGFDAIQGAYRPVLNSSGSTSFLANLRIGSGGVTSSTDSSVWSNGTGQLKLVAREGDAAPGMAVSQKFEFFAPPVMNSDGKVAFYAEVNPLSGGSSIDRAGGLWAENYYGNLTHVVCEGDLFEVAPNDFRTVSQVIFGNFSGGEDGEGVTFNDKYTLAFNLQFSDGTDGYFTATLIPEPSTWAMIVGCGLVGCFYVARRKKDEQAVAI